MFVRSARETDVSDITHICARGWPDAASEVASLDDAASPSDARFDESRLSRRLRQTDDHGWVVAVEDDAIVAVAGGQMTEDATGEVVTLHTHPETRRKRAGTAVLRTITAQQIVSGAREQWASCLDGDDETLSFYRARGFEVVSSASHTDAAGESVRLVRRI